MSNLYKIKAPSSFVYSYFATNHVRWVLGCWINKNYNQIKFKIVDSSIKILPILFCKLNETGSIKLDLMLLHAELGTLVVGLLDQYKLQQTQFNIVFRLFYHSLTTFVL